MIWIPIMDLLIKAQGSELRAGPESPPGGAWGGYVKEEIVSFKL